VYEDKTSVSIKETILDSIDIDIKKTEGSFIYDMVSPVSLEISKAYSEFDKMLSIMFLTDSTRTYIDKRVNEYGVYRKTGTKSMSIVVFTGINGTIVPKGTLVQTVGGLLFQTTSNVTIIGETASVSVEALQIGSKYNVTGSTITKIPISVPGITKVTNTIAATGGTDEEDDTSLVNRFLYQLRNPVTSGNASHYKQWAESVNGVGAAKVIPLGNGPGTVKIVVVDFNKRAADTILISNVVAYIEANRPIGASVSVESAIEKAISINVTLSIDSNNYSTDSIKTAIENNLVKYFKEIAFVSNYISCAYIGNIIFNTAGVLDYSNLLVNEGTSNISLTDIEIPVLNTITLS
jgi:uncharacterized phage protein gp47/JayE